jgi:exonuclease VII small subunit
MPGNDTLTPAQSPPPAGSVDRAQLRGERGARGGDHRRLDAGEASLTDTLGLLKEGKELIERCAGELQAVGGALEELRLEDLVARLEREGAKSETGG